MHQGDNQVGPVNAVDIIKYAFSVSGRHAAVVFGTSLILQGAVLVLSFLAMNLLGPLGIVVWALLVMVSYQLSAGIYTLFLLHLRHGHPMPSAIYLLKETAPLALPLLWLGLLVSLGLGLGFLFFIIPGVILWLRWAVATPAMVARRIPATEALAVSRQLTAGNYGTVFALFCLQNLIINVLPRLVTGSEDTMAVENILLIEGLLAAICTPVVSLSSAELFLRLARIPNRIAADAPLGGSPAPAPSGPHVPIPQATPAYGGGAVYGAPATTPANAYGAPVTHAQPYGAPMHAASAHAHPAPAHMYAANVASHPAHPQPYAAAPPAPPHAPAAPYAAAPPQPYAAAPPQPYAAAPPQPQPQSAFVPPTHAHVVPTAQAYVAAPPAQQPYAAAAPPQQAYVAAAPTPPPPPAPFQPAPGITGPPVAPQRAQSVAPPGMA